MIHLKTTILSLLIIGLSIVQLSAQCFIPSALKAQDGNNISATVSNGGDLFWDGSQSNFVAPVGGDLPTHTIFAAGLWMGGFDSNGTLRLAAQTYGRAYDSFDYGKGPLKEDGSIDEESCDDYDYIWKVTRADIEAHKADYADNGMIDNPIDAIYKWPGKGNPDFFWYNSFALPDMTSDFAPFFDQNSDGIYTPSEGDYPHPPSTIAELTPASINWTIFNDNILHIQTASVPIKAEVQLTSWSFDCFENMQLNNSLYTRHKIINKANEVIDSFHVGIWTDFDLGCYTDDFIGCSPEHNAYFVYNSDEIDGGNSAFDCIEAINSYGLNPPVQSVQFLNRDMDHFIYYNNGSLSPPPPPGTEDPILAQHYYNYLTGSWADGTRISYGGDGYNPTNGLFVDHVFPDNPFDEEGWSMKQEGLADGDRRTISSTSIGSFEPGEEVIIDMAYTFHQYNSINNQMDLLGQMYLDIEKVKQMYDMELNGWCAFVTDVTEVEYDNISISPNPSSGVFNLTANNIKINSLSLFDITGRFLWQSNENISESEQFEFNHFGKGVYLLKIDTEKGSTSRKLVIQ